MIFDETNTPEYPRAVPARTRTGLRVAVAGCVVAGGVAASVLAACVPLTEDEEAGLMAAEQSQAILAPVADRIVAPGDAGVLLACDPAELGDLAGQPPYDVLCDSVLAAMAQAAGDGTTVGRDDGVAEPGLLITLGITRADSGVLRGAIRWQTGRDGVAVDGPLVETMAMDAGLRGADMAAFAAGLFQVSDVPFDGAKD